MSGGHAFGYHDTVAPIDGFRARIKVSTLLYLLSSIVVVLVIHFLIIPFMMDKYHDTYTWKHHYFLETPTDVVVWLYVTAYPALMIFTVHYTRYKWHINDTRDQVFNNQTKKDRGLWTIKRAVAWKRLYYTGIKAGLSDLLRFLTLALGLLTPLAWIVVVLIVDFGSAAPAYYFHWVALYNRLKRVSVQLLHLHTGVIGAFLLMIILVSSILVVINVWQQLLKPPAHH